MKITIFVTIALSAVVGMTLADDMFNNWDNNNNNNGGFIGGIGGIGGISGGVVSSGLGGGMGHMGGYSAGYGAGYGSSGYGAGYGSSGYGAGYGSGYGSGYGGMQASYVPVPATGGSSGFNIGSILPLFALLFLFPLLSGSSTGTQDQIILLNSTLSG